MRSAPREMEIKLALDPGRRKQLLRAAPLARARRRVRELLAIYFDTPDGALAARGMALRLRREGRAWRQALKGGGGGAGGWHARDEWEFAADGPELDLARFAATPLAALDDAGQLHERLVEAFRVAVTRTTWRLGSGRHAVEVALDEGAVCRGEAVAPVSEVEIECVGGDVAAGFALAEALLAHVPLVPSAVTKAERGERLWRGTPLQPRKPASAALTARMSPGQSARAVAGVLLEALQANAEGVRESGDAEFVHQFRIALRRLRSVLRAHRRALAPGFEDAVRGDLRWIGRMAGAVRDLDAFAEGMLPALVAAGADAGDTVFLQRMEGRRRAARARLRRAIASPRYARLMLAIARWLATPPGPTSGGPGLAKFARKALRRERRRMLRGAAALAAMDPAGRHAVRIAAKRLRYTAEAFAPLFARVQVEPYLATLRAVQDDLGRANDAAVAQRLLASLAAPEVLARFAEGWLAAEREAALAALPAHFERLAATPPFWKHR